MLFSIYKTNKDAFTNLLMKENNIEPDQLSKFNSINEFYLEISEHFYKELKETSFHAIVRKIVISGRIAALESAIEYKSNVRENINFRIDDNEIKKMKKVKDEEDIYPQGIIFEMMVELFIAEVSESEFSLILKALRG